MSSVQAIEAKSAGWCLTHGDFAWLYDDDSVGCYYCQTVEISSADCKAEPRVLANADMLAAAIGSLPSPPSVLHPEESAAAILSALKGPAR